MPIRVGADASLGARRTGSCHDLGSGWWPGSRSQRSEVRLQVACGHSLGTLVAEISLLGS